MVVEFNGKDEYLSYLNNKNIKLLGSATEGKCYRASDGYVYKVFGLEGLTDSLYNVDDVVTSRDIFLDSFAFPEELYVQDGIVIGCRMKDAGRDLLTPFNLSSVDNMSVIDFNKFSKAYKRMLKDVYQLSNNNILMFDLPFNIVFNGEKLTGIDTLGYKRVSKNPLRENIESYNYAIEMIFKMWFDDYLDDDLTIKNNDIDELLTKVKRKLPDYVLDDMAKTYKKIK